MAGLGPAIHAFLAAAQKTWMPGPRPGMTSLDSEIVNRPMAVLVTRPAPDSETTAASLRARGYEVMQAPMLRFEPVACSGLDAEYGAVIVTSANALRAVEGQLGDALLKRPLFAVGETTANAARKIGFGKVTAAKNDASALRELVLAGVKKRQFKKSDVLLYLAGADLARDLASELGTEGLNVVTVTTYRMAALASRRVRCARALRRIRFRPCCITRNAAPAPSSMHRAPKASRSRRSPCRIAACRQISPRSSARPARRCFQRRQQMKRPCLRR